MPQSGNHGYSPPRPGNGGPRQGLARLKSRRHDFLRYVNLMLRAWAMRKFKGFAGHTTRITSFLIRVRWRTTWLRLATRRLMRSVSAGGVQTSGRNPGVTKREDDDILNHGKFASSPELVRLIGGQLKRGQIIDDWHEGIGDRIVAATTGAAASVGTATGLAIAAPAAVIDPVTREHLSEDVGELETELQDAGSSVTDGQSAH